MRGPDSPSNEPTVTNRREILVTGRWFFGALTIAAIGLTSLVGHLLLKPDFYSKSATIPLPDSDFTLTYTVYWGWKVEQEVVLSRGRPPRPVASSGHRETLDRADLSVSVYRALKSNDYYLGYEFGGSHINLRDATITGFCGSESKGLVKRVGPTGYYEGLEYLGRFELTNAQRSGDHHDFSLIFRSRHEMPGEDVYALDGSCG